VPDRSVNYRFTGTFTNLTAGLATAGRNVTELGVKMTALDANGRKMRAGLTQLGSTAGKIGLVAAAGVAVAVRAAANFDQAMSNVQAATHETADNMGLLRQAAIDAGQATQFSATEAAQAVEELAKAGVSTSDILAGGLAGAMSLAAAGGLEVGDAAEIAASALVQFGLAGKDVPHVADLLAAGAGKAQGSVQDLGYALKYAGVPAASLGVSIEETTGVLAEFASAGIVGEQAGTTLRAMLISLAAPTKLAQKTMEQYGISLYDANGKFVGIQAAAQELQNKLGPLSEEQRNQALNQLFTNAALQGAIKLYEGGGAAVEDWTNKVNDQGYAAETAAIKMDNLKGDLEQLRGSLETALIGAGSGSRGPLRSLVQDVTKAVNAFNNLPGPVKSSVTALAGLTAVTGGSLWFGTKVIGGITATKQALRDLGVSATTTTRLMKGIGVAAGVATSLIAVATAIRAINDASRESLPGVQGMTENLLKLTNSGDFGALGSQFADLSDDLDRLFNKSRDEKLGDALFTPFKGLLGNTRDTQEAIDEIETLDAALANLATTRGPQAASDALLALGISGGLTGDQMADLRRSLPQLDEALAGARLGADGATTAQDGLAAATSGAADAADDQAKAIEDAVKAMHDQRDAAVSAFDAITSYRQAMKDATAQAKRNNEGIDGNSKAALKNRDALGRLAAAWNSQDATVTSNVKKFKEARENFIVTAEAMGVPEKAAKALADRLLAIPDQKVVPVTLPGVEDATNKARTLKDILDGLHSKRIDIALHYQTIGNRGPTGGAPLPGGQTPRVASRSLGRSSAGDALSDAGITTLAPRLGDLSADAEAKSAFALSLLAKTAGDAAGGTHALRAHLHDLEKRLDRTGKAADRAHDALDSLKDQRAGLASSVTGALTHNPFGGSLSDFAAQVGADTADAQAMLAALTTLVQNGVDPKSAFFQQLASSGNVSLVQQFAALTRGELANYAASFAAGQSALSAVGEFVGNQAFNDAIRAQVKVTQNLDGTVHHLAQEVKHLQQVLDAMSHPNRGGRDNGGTHNSTRAMTRTGSR
jgi:TP901 family phage tail tape measure protein